MLTNIIGNLWIIIVASMMLTCWMNSIDDKDIDK